MSSRRFFYFLPIPGKALNFDRAIDELRQAGMEFDSTVYINSIDASGVVFNSRVSELEPPTERNLIELLSEESSVEIMCRDRSLALTCTFGSPHYTPLFSINVSRRLWFGLAEVVRETYELILVRVANESGAVNVLVVDDPPDDFFGRIELVDQQWMVDLNLSDGTSIDECTVLVNTKHQIYPAMRRLCSTDRYIANYREYKECLET